MCFAAILNEQNLKGHGSKKKISNTNATLSQQVNYVRKVLQDVQPYFDRRNNLRMRRLVASEETKNLIEDVNNCQFSITDKEEEIVIIKKEYGIEDSDIEQNFDSPLVDSYQEEE